jgi:hypothetical protein
MFLIITIESLVDWGKIIEILEIIVINFFTIKIIRTFNIC